MTAPLFDIPPAENTLPSLLAAIIPPLEQKFLDVMGGWGMSAVIQQDALPLIKYELESFDGEPDEVEFYAEAPEVYISLEMPSEEYGSPEWYAALDTALEPIDHEIGDGKQVATRWHYNYAFLHPGDKREVWGNITAKLRPDLSAWDVTLTQLGCA